MDRICLNSELNIEFGQHYLEFDVMKHFQAVFELDDKCSFLRAVYKIRNLSHIRTISCSRTSSEEGSEFDSPLSLPTEKVPLLTFFRSLSFRLWEYL